MSEIMSEMVACVFCGLPKADHEPSGCCGDGGGSVFTSPDNPMVERVAEAIHIARFNSPRGAYEPWEMDESDREYTTRLARAAIAVLTASPNNPQELIERQIARLKEVEDVLANGAYYGDDPECHPIYPQAVAARQIIVEQFNAYFIEIEGLRRRVGELEEALRPFARLCVADERMAGASPDTLRAAVAVARAAVQNADRRG